MSVRVWKIDRKAVLDRLAQWAQTLGQDKNILAVVLFGSLARGDQTAASDADVLIILEASSLRFDERIPAMLPLGMGISVDVFPYTLVEATDALKEGWGVVPVALQEGLFLFKREERLVELHGVPKI